MKKKMNLWSIGSISIISIFFLASFAFADSCIDGNCHKDIISTKFVHGPVAAEETGFQGCESCHVPTGAECGTVGGKFKLRAEKKNLCTMCHEMGTSTDHTNREGKCLSCHNPHGSEKGPTLMRAG